MLSLLLSLGCNDKDLDSGQVDIVEAIELNVDAGSDRYVELGQPFEVSTTVDTNVQVSWDFGDGTNAEGPEVSHTFNQVGRYRVVLTLTAPTGQRSSDTMNVVVHHPVLEQPPQVSHRMTVHQGILWTIYSEGNTLQGLSLDTDELYTKNICTNPSSIAVHENTLKVTCMDSAQIATIDLSSGPDTLEVNLLDLGDHLRPSAILPPTSDEFWWIVDAAKDQLGRLDSMDTITWFPVDGDLQGLSRHSNGTLILPHFRAQNDGGYIHTYNPDSNEWQEIHLPLDEDGDSDNTTGGTPNLLENVYPSPDGQTLWTPVTHANILRGSFLNGVPLSHETTLRGVLRTVEWSTQEDSITHRKQFDEKGRASAVATSAYGDVIYVLHPGVASISVLDGFSRQILGSLPDLGIHPTDLLQVSNTLYVYSWLTREIISFDIQDPIRPVHQWTRSFIDSEVLSPIELKGKQIFHDASDTRMTKTGYIACAHCHPAGDHDGQTWDHTDRGEGLRNTTSLLSRSGTGMGRLHWSGNFDEIQDFEQDIRDIFGGSGFLSDIDWTAHPTPLDTPRVGLSEDLDALAVYVTALPSAPISPMEVDTENVAHGEELFYQIGCGECHPAPLYTDSSLVAPVRHDIGTLWEGSGQRLDNALDGLDTPTLLNVRETFPYLHDGSAATLDEAIRAHSDYTGLNSEQVDALSLFLNSL